MFLGFLSQLSRRVSKFCYLLGGFNSWLEQGGYSFLICGCCILFLEPFGEESGLESDVSTKHSASIARVCRKFRNAADIYHRMVARQAKLP